VLVELSIILVESFIVLFTLSVSSIGVVILICEIAGVTIAITTNIAATAVVVNITNAFTL
jgi:hypothetical protein